MKTSSLAKGSLLGAVVAAITASLCCLGPLVLLSLGIGGAWISTLTNLGFLRPIGIVIMLGCLLFSGWLLYNPKSSCELDSPCAQPKHQQWQRLIFWITVCALALLVSFPWYAHLFY